MFAAKIGLVVPWKYVARNELGKMARVLCGKLQEMKEKYSHFAQNCKLPLDINIAFSKQ